MPQAQRVGARRDRAHGALLDADRVGNRLHLERIRDHEAVVAELHAKQVVEDLAAHRRGRIAERADDDVRGHDRLDAGTHRRAERRERRLLERVDDRQLVVRVLRRVAVAGEVLGAGRDARALKSAHRSRHVPPDELAVRAERADADDRVERIRVHVRDGRQVQVDSRLAQIRADGGGDALRQPDVVDRTERGVPGVRAPGRDLEAGHVAALLVDPDEDVAALGAEHARELAELRRALDVPAEEDDSAEPFGESPPHPLGRDGPLEAGQDDREREPLHSAHVPGVIP